MSHDLIVDINCSLVLATTLRTYLRSTVVNYPNTASGFVHTMASFNITDPLIRRINYLSIKPTAILPRQDKILRSGKMGVVSVVCRAQRMPA